MTYYRVPLNDEQLQEARRRYSNGKGERVAHIARSLGCRQDWLKCRLDAEFHQRRLRSRRERKQRRKEASPPSETDAQLLSDRRAVSEDLKFIAAMTRAIRKGEECAPMMTRKDPSTDSPRYTPHRGQGFLSITGSSSQSCADFA